MKTKPCFLDQFQLLSPELLTIFLQWKAHQFFPSYWGITSLLGTRSLLPDGLAKSEGRKEGRKDATHIRSDQTALIRAQHADNLGRSWCECVCVCALFGTQMEDSVARGERFVGVFLYTDMMQRKDFVLYHILLLSGINGPFCSGHFNPFQNFFLL